MNTKYSSDFDYESKDLKEENQSVVFILETDLTPECMYNELQLLGEGTMGKVFTAVNINEQIYAIKRILLTGISNFMQI